MIPNTKRDMIMKRNTNVSWNGCDTLDMLLMFCMHDTFSRSLRHHPMTYDVVKLKIMLYVHILNEQRVTCSA